MKKNLKFFIAIVITVIVLVVIIKTCSKEKYQKIDEFTINYSLPEDLREGASEKELAEFAWKEFFALNWESSWEKDSLRDQPNKNWTPKQDNGQPNLAVWETFIHRTELRPANGKRTKDLSKGKPYYTFVDSTLVNNGTNKLDLSNYWNILDEDNEIGSAYLFSNENQNEVLYMAKTNLVEYNYLKKHFPTDALLYTAGDRISSKNIKDNPNSEANLQHFKSLKKKGMCASDSLTENGYICLPCGDEKGDKGATEIKLAFRKLDSLTDDVRRFITKKVVVFVQDKESDSIIAKEEIYGLIGMHIIHKSKNYPTFIFASFEQVDVRNNNMQTIGIDTVKVDTNKYVNEDPHRLNPVIERVIPESIQDVNKRIKQTLVKLYPNSKWQYYQLVGVQANPTDYSQRNNDNNYFMANYVIESDLKLTNFHGSFKDPFNSIIQNVVSNGNSYNMGGCMGCHGQAQVSFGTDFSFLLDGGNGKPVIKPDLLQTYEAALNSVSEEKLKAFLRKKTK